MAAQDTRTVTVPRQAGPADPPLGPTPRKAEPAPRAPLIGAERPLHPDERMFLIGIAGVFAALATMIVTFLLLAEFVWG